MPQDDEAKRDLAAGVPVGELAAHPLLAGRVGEEDVVLVRGSSGVFAIGSSCTHSGAPLAKGLVVGDTVRCPWHHACFDARSGAALAAPAFQPVGRWSVAERNGMLYVGAKLHASPASPQAAGTDRIVIVGAGAGGVAAADTLARFGGGCPVTLIGNEAEPPYDRTMLTKHFLAGTAGETELPMKVADLAARGIALRLGATVTAIEPEAKLVHFADDTTLPYDKLILATGAEPKRLTVPGAELPHVRTLRSAEDARALLASLPEVRRVVVVGGSFIGMEAAAALRDQEVAVTVVAPDEKPLAKVFGEAIAEAIVAVHRKHGTAFRLGRQVSRIEPDSVVLDDGSALAADLVLVGIGVSPRVALAERAGLTVENGITVDERLRTSQRDIFAVGDIAAWPDPHSGERIRVEHWDVAQRQGQVAALNALGHGLRYDAVPFFWTLHFDYSVRYVGHATAWDDIAIAGDPADKDAVVRFRKGGRDLAVATVERDMDSLLAEREMERRLGGPTVCLPD